jgi:Icc-related predicted phosphoesterase
MKIVCLADTHSQWSKVKTPEADVLIHAGDWDCFYTETFKKFLEWFVGQPQKYKILVAGNHDKLAFILPDEVKRYCKHLCYYLEDSGVTIEGVNFWGSPWTPKFGNWFFTKQRGPELKKHWDKIPLNTDVLITHGPAFGKFDEVRKANGDIQGNVGDVDLMNVITDIRPKVHICGHLHDNHGSEQHGETLFINATLCGIGNNIEYEPIVFDMPS